MREIGSATEARPGGRRVGLGSPDAVEVAEWQHRQQREVRSDQEEFGKEISSAAQRENFCEQ